MNTDKHPCEIVYDVGGNKMVYGNTPGDMPNYWQ